MAHRTGEVILGKNDRTTRQLVKALGLPACLRAIRPSALPPTSNEEFHDLDMPSYIRGSN
jgi:hypothetical protein